MDGLRQLHRGVGVTRVQLERPDERRRRPLDGDRAERLKRAGPRHRRLSGERQACQPEPVPRHRPGRLRRGECREAVEGAKEIGALPAQLADPLEDESVLEVAGRGGAGEERARGVVRAVLLRQLLEHVPVSHLGDPILKRAHFRTRGSVLRREVVRNPREEKRRRGSQLPPAPHAAGVTKKKASASSPYTVSSSTPSNQVVSPSCATVRTATDVPAMAISSSGLLKTRFIGCPMK